MANLDILTVRQCELAGGRRVFVIIHSPVAAYGMLTARPMSANCAYSETEMFANHGKLASIDPSRVSVAMWQCYSEPRRKPLDERQLHAQSNIATVAMSFGNVTHSIPSANSLEPFYPFLKICWHQ